MKTAPKPERRKYDETFKREAVQHWLSSSKSGGTIAEELGILPNRLYRWRQRFAPAPAGAGAKPPSCAELQAQLDAALRENRQLREQRDILKKTLGILSAPPASASPGSTR